jgi:hypothetical protein
LTERSVHISFKINFPVILIIVLFLHALLLVGRQMPPLMKFASEPPTERRPLQIKDIRTVGARDAKLKDSTYLQKSNTDTKSISKERFREELSKSSSQVETQPPKSLSMSDLSVAQIPPALNKPQQRPGERPELEKPKGLAAIKLKGQEIKEFAQTGGSTRPQMINGSSSNAAKLSGDPRAASLSNSDILVNLEVPEGVNPDELNKFELMFYSFQRRTAINYINSFYNRLNKFQQQNPHISFPMTESKQVMTGRLTYDEKGNIKQIKMIRWTNVDKLQDFFLDVLKDMDTLHNPPQALWEKTGEFSIFFSLVVNG